MVVRLDHEGNPMREGEQVEIGGNESYESVCRKHFREFLWD
jgi:thymidine kinase